MFRRILARGWFLLRTMLAGWQKHGGSLLSAATAYYAAFSLFPLCLVLIAVLGFVGRYSSFAQTEQTELLARVSQNVSPWLAGELENILAGVQARAALGGPLGLLFLLLTGIGLFTQLQYVFDRIWGGWPAGAGGWWAAVRNALWERLLAFLTLLAVGGLMAVVSAADLILASLRPYLVQLPAGQSTWQSLQWLSAVGCDALLLAVLYHALPRVKIRRRDALAGGLFAALVWAVGRYLLLFLVTSSKYSAYGVVGVLMGLMLWFYFASAVLFLGAEFVHALGLPRPTDKKSA